MSSAVTGDIGFTATEGTFRCLVDGGGQVDDRPVTPLTPPIEHDRDLPTHLVLNGDDVRDCIDLVVGILPEVKLPGPLALVDSVLDHGIEIGKINRGWLIVHQDLGVRFRRYTVRLREARRVIHCVRHATVIEYNHHYQIAVNFRPYISRGAQPNVNKGK